MCYCSKIRPSYPLIKKTWSTAINKDTCIILSPWRCQTFSFRVITVLSLIHSICSRICIILPVWQDLSIYWVIRDPLNISSSQSYISIAQKLILRLHLISFIRRFYFTLAVNDLLKLTLKRIAYSSILQEKMLSITKLWNVISIFR